MGVADDQTGLTSLTVFFAVSSSPAWLIWPRRSEDIIISKTVYSTAVSGYFDLDSNLQNCLETFLQVNALDLCVMWWNLILLGLAVVRSTIKLCVKCCATHQFTSFWRLISTTVSQRFDPIVQAFTRSNCFILLIQSSAMYSSGKLLQNLLPYTSAPHPLLWSRRDILT